jgi:hypothetical protein
VGEGGRFPSAITGILLAVVAVAMLTVSCVPPAARLPAAPSDKVGAAESPSPLSHVRLHVQRITQIPNSGLLLPTVSPDGQWVAYLDLASARPPNGEAMLTGQGASSMSLHARSLADGSSRQICAQGAAWPVWSPDSGRLVFFSHDRGGNLQLGLHDVAANRADFRPLPVGAAAMPAISPDGRKLALVSFEADASASRLHLCDLDSGRLLAAPPDLGAGHPIWPAWTGANRLAVVMVEATGGRIVEWDTAAGSVAARGQIAVADSPAGLLAVGLTIASLAAGDQAHLAYFDAGAKAITIHSLSSEVPHSLAPLTQSGCWQGSRQFLAGTDESLLLYRDLGGGGGKPLSLISGRWLPRWADPSGQKVLALTQGARPELFELVRIDIVPE